MSSIYPSNIFLCHDVLASPRKPAIRHGWDPHQVPAAQGSHEMVLWEPLPKDLNGRIWTMENAKWLPQLEFLVP